MSTEMLLKQHHLPTGWSDRFALAFTKSARFVADTFFARRYGHRAVVLETVAAVPGMVRREIDRYFQQPYSHHPEQADPEQAPGRCHHRGDTPRRRI